MQNTTLTYKQPLKPTDKKYQKLVFFYDKKSLNCLVVGQTLVENSCLRETKHISTNADSSTNTTVGWTKNTKKTIFFEKRKKSSKTQKLKNV